MKINNSFSIYIKQSLLFASCFLITPAWAQDIIPLKDMLQRVEMQYNVRFSFKSELIHGVQVKSTNLSEFKTVEQALNKILTPIDLNYSPIQGKYYSIITSSNKGYHKENTISKNTKTYKISGLVLDKNTKLPLPYATLEIENLNLKTQANQTGKFTFPRLPTGSNQVRAQYVGYVSTTFTLKTPDNETNNLDSLFLEKQSLDLETVVVTSKETSTAGEATQSSIGRMALKHMQATSLADALQLLPGKLAENPSLTSVNKVSLRQVGTDNAGSLGVSLIVNGVPISNNANLQLNNTATGGVAAGYSTTAGAGLDFRQFPADNIESIEVIRGIPSVSYGDLTSGAIIVKTLSGIEPLQLKSRITPTAKQFWIGRGFELSPRAGVLNIDTDYTRATSDPRFTALTYDRYTFNAVQKVDVGRHKKLNLQNGFTIGINSSQRKPDPDDPKDNRSYAKDFTLRFYSNGIFDAKKLFARTLTYTLSADIAQQKSYEQARQSGGFPIVYAMETGINPAILVNGSYLSQLWVDGKPFNAYAKLNNSFFGKVGITNHRVQMGVEWRSNVNFGKGKQYDQERPPSLETGVGTRPRSYKDIPGLNQYALYLEDRVSIPLANRMLTIQAGLRYDNIQPNGLFSASIGQVLAPRINASYELFSGFQLRAGYGIAAKAPTLAYLYPQESYFDAISLNHVSDNQAERLVLVSTYVTPTENKDLKIAKNTKREIGFSWSNAIGQFNVTAYFESMKNAYDYQHDLQTFQVLNVPQYSVIGRPVGKPPIVSESPTSYRTYFASYNRPTNGLGKENKGVEFDLNFKQIKDTRTSFVLSGAWLSSNTTQNTFYVFKKSRINNEERKRVGIFPSGRGRENQLFTTTLRTIQHIPQFSLIASLTVQTIWIDLNKYLNYEKKPIGYMKIEDQSIHWLTATEQANLDPIKDEDILQDITDSYYITEKWKPLSLINFRLTKEFGKTLDISFYANNVLQYRPLQASTRWPDRYERRNPSLFFGVELNVKLFK